MFRRLIRISAITGAGLSALAGNGPIALGFIALFAAERFDATRK